MDSLQVSGQIPQWLAGSLIRTTPARWTVGREKLNHWFDGLAMLYRFTIRPDNVSYASKYLRSNAFLTARERGKIGYREFNTDPRRSGLSRLTAAPGTDNDNVNISILGDEYVALSETNQPIAFDPVSLETKEHLQFEDKLQGQVSTAHPHLDFSTGESFNYAISMSIKSYYRIYKIRRGRRQRQLIAEIPVDRPSYMHSFAITPNYVILSEWPLCVAPLDLALGRKPFISTYGWRPQEGTQFIVAGRADGSVIKVQAEPYFAFHHVNAFESDGRIVMDICAYADQSIIQCFLMDSLMHKEQAFPAAHITRFILDLNKGTSSSEQLADIPFEFPRINYPQYHTKQHRFVYGASTYDVKDFLNELVKVDMQGGKSWTWRQAGAYPGEPVFVANPRASGEDDGVILSVVLDSQAEKSFLLMLDARDFSELGRAQLPHSIPFGFHGNFYRQRPG